MKVLIFGDIHAGKNRNNPIFHKILLEYGDWIKQVANEYGITRLIQLGDIFDNRFNVSHDTFDTVNRFIDLLEPFKIDIIVGNHDCMYNDNASVNWLTPLKKHPNVTVHDTVTVEDDMVFAGWGVKLEQIPKCKLFFGHIDTVGYELQKNKLSTHGFKASDLMDRVSGLVFTGHYHLAQSRKYDGKTLCYTGSAYSLDWNDVNTQKYIYILDTDTLEVVVIPNNKSPKFYHIDNESQLNLIPGNFISINYRGTTDDKWKLTVENLQPLDLKINKIVTKVTQVENDILSDIAKFKVVDIKEALLTWPKDNLNNISPELKKRVAEKVVSMYDGLI